MACLRESPGLELPATQFDGGRFLPEFTWAVLLADIEAS